MRVAILSYPMLFQRVGGLQVQVRETMAALREIGIDASLFDIYTEKLRDFDLAHVFAAINGNHRIVEAATKARVPVVLSSVLHPPASKREAWTAELLDRLTGRLSGWQVQTTHRHIKAALHKADRVLTLGRRESDLILGAYGIEDRKLRVVENGISERFFRTDGAAFKEKSGVAKDFALCIASLSPYKNQLRLIEALRDVEVDIVLIGECEAANQDYLARCLVAGGDRVHYLGALDHGDPLLAAAYAAARVTVLCSKAEVAPLTALESLAADTPVVLTAFNSLDLEADGSALSTIDPERPAEIRQAVRGVLERRPQQGACRALAEPYRWPGVARKIADVYGELLSRDQACSTVLEEVRDSTVP